MPVFMQIAAFEIAHVGPAPRQTHLTAGGIEVVGIDEVDADVADHLVRSVAEDRFRAGADLDELAAAVGDHDEVERGLEDAPVQFVLVREL